MKREFGTKLIEGFLVRQDLRLVADTSGAYIPGHGTPTVIIVGRNQQPIEPTVRAVLGVRGEPGQPDNPAKGIVWTTIVDHVDIPGWEDSWITIADLARSRLAVHPWSLNGGRATDVAAAIEQAGTTRLDARIASIGRTTASGEDEAFFVASHKVHALGLKGLVRRVVIGECLRDYSLGNDRLMWWPYQDAEGRRPVDEESPLPSRVLWPYRTGLSQRVIFGQTLSERGRPWYEHLECYSSKLGTPRGIGFAFVATHNHFAFDKSSRLFNRSAPVIKLPESASRDDHLSILAVLNSSTACFWLKQRSQAKTGADNTSGGGNRWSPEPWYSFYEFTGTALKAFPLPQILPLDLGCLLDELAQEIGTHDPSVVCARETPSASTLRTAQDVSNDIHTRMVALQEELDWKVYKFYGHSAHSRVVIGSAGFCSGYGESACAGGRHGLPSMRSCRTSMAFLP